MVNPSLVSRGMTSVEVSLQLPAMFCTENASAMMSKKAMVSPASAEKPRTCVESTDRRAYFPLTPTAIIPWRYTKEPTPSTSRVLLPAGADDPKYWVGSGPKSKYRPPTPMSN